MFMEHIYGDIRKASKLSLFFLDYGQFPAPPSLMNYYLAILKNTHLSLFRYLSQEQKDKLKYELQITLYLLKKQAKKELDFDKKENLASYGQQARKCRLFIKILSGKKEHFLLERDDASEGYLIKYVALFLGQDLALKMAKWPVGKTKAIKGALGFVNEKRLLYGVWGTSLLKMILTALPPDFFHADYAYKNIQSLSPYLGNLSYLLYYFRLGIELVLFFKHSIENGNMSPAEIEAYAYDDPWGRMSTQWKERKFAILNDLLWATANLLGFILLYGPGLAGTCGDILTLVLLGFDAGVALWDFEEQELAYWEEINFYDQQILSLQEKISLEKENPLLPRYQSQLEALEKAKALCESEWKYRSKSLSYTLTYSLGLIFAFFLLALPFIPLSAPVAGTASILGGGLSYAFTVLHKVKKDELEINKTQDALLAVQAVINSELEQFQQLQASNSLDDKSGPLLFLKIQYQRIEAHCLEQKITFQNLHLLRSILLQTLSPAVVFTSLVFLPLGMGTAALGTAFILAAFSNAVINEKYTPQEKDEFDPNVVDYSSFREDPTAWWANNKDQPLARRPNTLFPSARPECKDDEAVDEGLSIRGRVGKGA